MAEIVGCGAVKYVDGLLEELSRQAPLALLDGGQSAVHKARVATRRLGAALELLTPLIAPHQHQPMRQSLKRIRRCVQQLRDMDVMAEHLQGMIDRGEHVEPAKRVLKDLEGRRGKAAGRVADPRKLHKWLGKLGMWVSVRGMLLGQNEAVAGLTRDAVLEQHGAFAAQADRLAQGLQEPSSADHGIEPHVLRISGKNLRYTLEIAQAQDMAISDGTLKQFKRLQDALGLWHDYHVLSQQILESVLAEMSAGGYRGDEDQMVELASATLAMSHQDLAEFAKLWMESRQAIADEINGSLTPPCPEPAATANSEAAPNPEAARALAEG